MKKLIIAMMLGALSLTAYSGPISDAQIKSLCKIVDPTFLHQLPTMVELKNSGVARRFAVGSYAYINSTYGSTNGSHIVAIETLYESEAKTVEEALSVIESSCVKKITDKTN